MFLVLLRFSDNKGQASQFMVTAEIIEITPSRTDARLSFLLG